ncbi:prolipoprotein diacylglyceryl transferase [Chitinispirillales bacterium ANBcel5]|uniref:prolipoprotein diacylglyceryl transferase n=1 Tax=Cellulosispirillum alkaliphilum TaxID=3039283 RepID=UPI002A5587B7|nr:prolipoprotein diacylglyceryl transferase [Chitinispirillales bacterium ANBcel5]
MSHINWNINPEIVNIFGISIRYYGVLFGAGVLLCLYILRWIFENENIPSEKGEKLPLYLMIGALAGARLGHTLFYQASYYLSNPLEIFLPIQRTIEGGYRFSGFQGLASHGGAIGLIIAFIIYSKKAKLPMVRTMDLIAIVAPLGAFFVRLGNLMNSEIVGLPTSVPWAFVFQRNDSIPRHPAQLYEATAYLFTFLVLLFLYKAKKHTLKNGFYFGLSMIMIFIARFFIEFVKERHVAFEEHLALSMGQLLSIPFVLLGIGFIVFGYFGDKKLLSSKGDGLKEG